MDDDDGEIFPSRRRRSTPWLRSWLPSPQYLIEQLFSFFTPWKLCSDPRLLTMTGPVSTADIEEEGRQVTDEGIFTRSEFEPKPIIPDTDQRTSFQERRTRLLSIPAKPNWNTTSVDDTESARGAARITTGITEYASLSSSSGRVERRGVCRSLSHFRGDSVSGRCPCFVNENDPSRLRDFLQEENISDSAHYKSVHKDYGVVTVRSWTCTGSILHWFAWLIDWLIDKCLDYLFINWLVDWLVGSPLSFVLFSQAPYKYACIMFSFIEAVLIVTWRSRSAGGFPGITRGIWNGFHIVAESLSVQGSPGRFVRGLGVSRFLLTFLVSFPLGKLVYESDHVFFRFLGCCTGWRVTERLPQWKSLFRQLETAK